MTAPVPARLHQPSRQSEEDGGWHSLRCLRLSGMSAWRLNRWNEDYRLCLDCGGIETRPEATR